MIHPRRLWREATGRAEPGAPIRTRFLSGAFWSLVGSFAVQALRIPAGVVTARVLGADAYGQLGMINSTVGMFDQLSRLRLGATASTYVAALHRKDPDRARRIAGLTSLVGLVSGAVMCAAVIWAAPWLCEHQLKRPELAPLLALSGVMLLWGGLSAPQNGVLQGLECFRLLAVLGTISSVIALGLKVGGVLYWGLAGIIWAMVIADALDWLIDHIALRRELRRRGMGLGFRGAAKEADVLIHFSLPSTLAAMIVGPAMWIAHSALVRTEGGYRELGLFNAAFVWQALAGNVPQVLGGVLIPILSAHDGEDRPHLETFNLLMGWIIVTAAALPFIAFPDFVQLIHGHGFAGEGYQRALILVMGFACVESYNMGIARQIQVKRMVWWGFAANALWCVLLVTGAHALRGHGAAGLAGAYFVAYTLKTGLFAPLHIARGIVPRRLMLAPPVLLVWAALIAMGLISFFGAPMWARGVAFVLCAEAAAIGFWLIWKRGSRGATEA